jgi:hypothetical protein
MKNVYPMQWRIQGRTNKPRATALSAKPKKKYV